MTMSPHIAQDDECDMMISRPVIGQLVWIQNSDWLIFDVSGWDQNHDQRLKVWHLGLKQYSSLSTSFLVVKFYDHLASSFMKDS